MGRVLQVSATQILTTAKTHGPDSGGPLFTLHGELVGVTGLVANEVHGTGHARVELFQQVRDQLLAGQHIRNSDLSNPFAKEARPVALANENRGAVVTLEAAGKRVAFGMVVSADGWIVSKRSNCRGELICRLADGSTIPAALISESRKFDLALLKIAHQNLQAVAWSKRDPKPGMVVASVIGAKETDSFGVIGAPISAVESERGFLSIETELADGNRGVRITRAYRPRTQAITITDAAGADTVLTARIQTDGNSRPKPLATVS